MTHFTRLAAATLLVLLPAMTAWAQPKGQGPCRADVERLCKDVEQGQGRIRMCLKQHESDLSPDCKKHISEGARQVGACKADVEKYCSTVTPGKGAIRTCLAEHTNELSDACKTQLASERGPHGSRP